MRESEFSLSTDLGDRKYDIITLFHLVYYFPDREERVRLFEKLQESLGPRGVICLLLVAEGDGHGRWGEGVNRTIDVCTVCR